VKQRQFRPRYIRSWRTGHIEQDYDGKFYYVDHSGQRHNINFVRDGVSETGVLDEAKEEE
jgi:hypothetical protein